VLLAACFTVLLSGNMIAQAKVKTSTKPAAKAAAVSLVDVNTASKADLVASLGIDETAAQKIIDGRPYARKSELVSKKILPAATYAKVRNKITAKRTLKSK
jgi:DNA uptake protein ComE-like DNA-binding protein